MRKQLYYALAAVILGGAAVPETSAAEVSRPTPLSTTAVLHAADANHAQALKKRKKRKKHRSSRRRHR
jgi:CelD/BcsL family acetyltransferase involved in cellulose biosynthesis